MNYEKECSLWNIYWNEEVELFVYQNEDSRHFLIVFLSSWASSHKKCLIMQWYQNQYYFIFWFLNLCLPHHISSIPFLLLYAFCDSYPGCLSSYIVCLSQKLFIKFHLRFYRQDIYGETLVNKLSNFILSYSHTCICILIYVCIMYFPYIKNT